MPFDMTGWDTIDRPGYFGKHRNRIQQEYDAEFGADSWRLAWHWNERFLSRDEMVMLYEDAYLGYLRSHELALEQLVGYACDVYDDAPSNTGSGLDYGIQETERNHVQDVAIRRCLVRLGEWFKGDHLLQIRDKDGSHPLSLILSPGRIPFHMQDFILRPQLEGWWEPGSVESFYQSNKVLQVRRSGENS